jgi:hypothetical protein
MGFSIGAEGVNICIEGVNIDICIEGVNIRIDRERGLL